MEIINVVIITIASIVSLFVIAKIIGHKQMSQLDFFDYISGITIGSIAAEMILEVEKPWKPMLAMIIYGLVTFGLAKVTSRFSRARKYINGTPTILMDNGKIYRENLKKAKLDLSEFMVMCRQLGYFNLEDIQTAVFEYNGRLSVLPVSNKRPVNPEDMNLKIPIEHIGTEVIMDGRVLSGNLKRLGFEEKWLQKQLEKQGYHDVKEVFLAICDGDKKLKIYSK